MFPPGKHVRTCGKSVTHASEAGFGAISRKFRVFKKIEKISKKLRKIEKISKNLKKFEKILIFRKKQVLPFLCNADARTAPGSKPHRASPDTRRL